jgi:SAM-dependent methyltransferase
MTTPDKKALHEENRLSWNEATKAHNSHKGDQAAWFRAGGSTLRQEELDLLGDLKGLRGVHLQCNSGQDTLSLARLGASMTGVDISDEAIAFAATLSQDSGIPASFVRSDVYDWLEQAAAAGEQFDLVFSSYGAICWLSNLDAWARGFAALLRPGGRYVTVDFHPIAMIYDEDWRPKYNYFMDGEHWTWEDGIGDYVAASQTGLVFGAEPGIGVQDFKNPYRVHEFQWTIAEVVSALTGAGLRLEALREYPYSNGARLFNEMKDLGGRRWGPPEGAPQIPLMYGLSARKP